MAATLGISRTQWLVVATIPIPILYLLLLFTCCRILCLLHICVLCSREATARHARAPRERLPGVTKAQSLLWGVLGRLRRTGAAV